MTGSTLTMPGGEELTLESALKYLDRFDSEFQDIIHSIMQVREHPGFRALVAYMKVDHDEAIQQLADVSPLDSKEIMRLQSIVKRYEWLMKSPEEIILAQVAKEIVDAADTKEYDD